MTDRYDELMLGLYQGTVPSWIPSKSRDFFVRESLRRRCALGQSLVAKFGCSVYYARSVFTPDIVEEVHAAWPKTRFRARNVVTGLYLAAESVFSRYAECGPALQLLRYEALAVTELTCCPEVPTVRAPAGHEDELAEAEIFRFEYDVAAFQARMLLYAGGIAPASFARAFQTPRKEAFVARVSTPRGYAVQDISSLFEGPEEKGASDSATDLH